MKTLFWRLGRQIESCNPIAFAPKVIRSTDATMDIGVRNYPQDYINFIINQPRFEFQRHQRHFAQTPSLNQFDGV
jgi:hypothetical protein